MASVENKSTTESNITSQSSPGGKEILLKHKRSLTEAVQAGTIFSSHMRAAHRSGATGVQRGRRA